MTLPLDFTGKTMLQTSMAFKKQVRPGVVQGFYLSRPLCDLLEDLANKAHVTKSELVRNLLVEAIHAKGLHPDPFPFLRMRAEATRARCAGSGAREGALQGSLLDTTDTYLLTSNDRPGETKQNQGVVNGSTREK